MTLYLEDFSVGETFGSGRLRVDQSQISRFAAAFDPQPFHLDAEGARETRLGRERLAYGRAHHAPPGRGRVQA